MKTFEERQLALVAFGLVGITALLHLFAGLTAMAEAVTGDGTAVYGLVLLLGAVLPGLLLYGHFAGHLRPVTTYALGFVMMVAFIAAYVDVHAIGTLESVTGLDLHGHAHDHAHENGHHHDDAAGSYADDHGHGHNGDDGHAHGDNGHGHADDVHAHHDHGHDDSAVQVVIDHLADDLVALGAKAAELGAATLFGVLALLESTE